MNAANMEKHFSRNHTSSCTGGLTQERSPLSVVSVGKPALRTHALLYTRGLTWERSPMNALTVGRPSPGRQTSLDIIEPTLGRSCMDEVRSFLSRSHTFSTF